MKPRNWPASRADWTHWAKRAGQPDFTPRGPVFSLYALALADAVNGAGVLMGHEALIREWPTLREWLNADREGLRLHRHLTEAAQEWARLGRDPGELYRGARLAQATERRRLTVAWYGGGTRQVEAVTGIGHWYKSGQGLVAVRWVYVRDQTGTCRPLDAMPEDESNIGIIHAGVPYAMRPSTTG